MGLSIILVPVLLTICDHHQSTSELHPPMNVSPLTVGDTKPANAPTTKIKWRKYKAGLAEAKRTERPLFILFEASYEPWQQLLRMRTLSDPKISKILCDQYVPVLVNAENYPKLLNELNIKWIPTVILAEADGTTIMRLLGFRSVEKLMSDLDTAAKLMR